MALTDNLISYWELEEASGTRNDAHGANHLTDNNTVTSGTGLVGTAASFAAASLEYLSRVDNASLSTGNIDFTICAWIKLTGTGSNCGIIGKSDGGGYEYRLGFDISPYMSFAVCSADGYTNETSVNTTGYATATNWHFIVAWHDSVADTINIQLDNGTPVSTAYSAGSFDSTKPLEIGRINGDQYMGGLLDQVGFWKRVLTDPERTDLYNGGAGRAYSYIAGGATTPITVNNLPIDSLAGGEIV